MVENGIVIFGEYITISHSFDNKPLHRVINRIVLFKDRHNVKGFKYHSGQITKGIHYASVTKCVKPLIGDEKYMKPNELISVT